LRVFGLGRLDADFQAFDVLDPGDLLLRVHVAEAHGEEAQDLAALDGVLDHGAKRVGHLLVGEGLLQMDLVAEDEVQREHPRLRRHRRGVGGRGDDEVDVTRAHLLQCLGLGAELRARKLVDAQLAAAQLLQLLVEDVGGEAVRRGCGLVVREAKLPLRRSI